MNNLPIAIQIRITQQKLDAWKHTEYDARLDAEIAQELEEDTLLQQAMKRMKNTKRAIDLLEEKLTDLKAVLSTK